MLARMVEQAKTDTGAPPAPADGEAVEGGAAPAAPTVDMPPIFEFLKTKKSIQELEKALKDPEIVKDVNTKTGRKGTPLLYAMVSRAYAKVDILLKHGADPSLQDTLLKYNYDTPISPIFIAAGSGALATAETLYAAGADITVKHMVDLDEQGVFETDFLSSTFMRSNKAGDPIAMMAWVIKKGKEKGCFSTWDINFRLPGNLRKTMLGICVAAKSWATAYLLLENGADPNLADNEGWTPLHTTCMADNPNISLLLMMWGSNDAARTEDDQAWMPGEKADAATRNAVKNGALYRRMVTRGK